MNYFAMLIEFIASIFSALGSFFLKKGSKKFKLDVIKILKNYSIMLGAFIYLLATVLCIYALTMEDLSLLYPIMSLSYVWVSLLSIKFLREKMNFFKWLGIGLIIIGVIFITL